MFTKHVHVGNYDNSMIIAWFLSCLGFCAEEGIMPSSRHDGEPFLPNEIARIEASGKGLPFHAAVIGVRADWSECSMFIAPATHRNV